MSITREQFIRAFNVLKNAQAGREAVEEAAVNAGFGSFDLGINPVAHELERLLGELCRDREDEDGPWPDDCFGEGDLTLSLHWSEYSSITDEQGNKIDIPKTPEGLWDMWQETKTGPFREGVSA